MNIEIRSERAGDSLTIRQVTEAAFKLNPHSGGTEGAIIDALRHAGVLTISLVAAVDSDIVGHAAFSPVSIGGQMPGWFGLGPVSVRPDLHKKGIGSALISEGLVRLKKAAAKGCVVLGAPAYYQRFGFENDLDLRFPDAPPEYFMRLSFDDGTPSGIVAYHESFSTT